MSDDIIDKLRNAPRRPDCKHGNRPKSCLECAIEELECDIEELECDIEELEAENTASMAEITRLRAENERLREALEPLAKVFLWPDDLGAETSEDIKSDPDYDDAANDMASEEVHILRGDVRRARAALKENSDE